VSKGGYSLVFIYIDLCLRLMLDSLSCFFTVMYV
jgi:hypothetical protein